jgi:methyl-accepting chemotaxis protein
MKKPPKPSKPKPHEHDLDAHNHEHLCRIEDKIDNLFRSIGDVMEAIQSFSARVKASFTAIGTSVDGIVSDVTELKRKIEELQASPGTLTPEDQAALDEIESMVGATASKLADLDAATATAPAPQ